VLAAQGVADGKSTDRVRLVVADGGLYRRRRRTDGGAKRLPRSGRKTSFPRSPWVSPEYASDIRQTIDLSKDQARAALELTHRTDGGFIASKCPTFVRHAIVFYNAKNQAVGTMGVCFECTDTESSPEYFPPLVTLPRRRR
jgi:hypothetical protein